MFDGAFCNVASRMLKQNKVIAPAWSSKTTNFNHLFATSGVARSGAADYPISTIWSNVSSGIKVVARLAVVERST